jgi:hypothetical protein
MNKILTFEIIGTIFAISFGGFLHFAFEISGQFLPLATIAAVNESVFEHLKLGFWPIIIWGLIAYIPLRNEAKNFIIAKTAAAVISPIIIIGLFYFYTIIFNVESLIIDILIFIISVIIAQIASYKLLKRESYSQSWKIVFSIGLILLLILFSLGSFYPPELFLFQDPVSGGYGII